VAGIAVEDLGLSDYRRSEVCLDKKYIYGGYLDGYNFIFICSDFGFIRDFRISDGMSGDVDIDSCLGIPDPGTRFPYLFRNSWDFRFGKQMTTLRSELGIRVSGFQVGGTFLLFCDDG
jgi:hypothetical protein